MMGIGSKKQQEQEAYASDYENGHYAPEADIPPQAEQMQQPQPQQHFAKVQKNNMAQQQQFYDEAPVYPARSKSGKKLVAISIIASVLIGFVGGFAFAKNGEVDESSIRQSIEESLMAEKEEMNKTMALSRQALDIVSAYNLAFSKREAIEVIDQKLQKLSNNIRRAKQNVGADNSIRELNPKLYASLISTIEEDGNKQTKELENAREILARAMADSAEPKAPQKPAGNEETYTPPLQEATQQMMPTQGTYQPAHTSTPEVIEEDILGDSIFQTPSVAEEENHAGHNHTEMEPLPLPPLPAEGGEGQQQMPQENEGQSKADDELPF